MSIFNDTFSIDERPDGNLFIDIEYDYHNNLLKRFQRKQYFKQSLRSQFDTTKMPFISISSTLK